MPGVSANGIVTERAAPGVEIVTVTGEHDLSSAPELERILDEAFKAGGPVAVDLLGTTFIDSTVKRYQSRTTLLEHNWCSASIMATISTVRRHKSQGPFPSRRYGSHPSLDTFP